jgi:hypothetical protein
LTMVLFVCLFFSFLLTMVLFVCLYFSWQTNNTMVKIKQTNNTMVKRKEKTDKQYHGQK